MTPLNRNPFLTVFLPLGYLDDLLMHAMLALSGAHLSHREPGNTQVANTTALHYSRVASGLRAELAALTPDDVGAQERLLRVSLILSHYEVIAFLIGLKTMLTDLKAVIGDTQGMIFPHLKASRHLLLALSKHDNTAGNQHCLQQETWGLCLELYVYLTCCNTFAPEGLLTGHTMPVQELDAILENLSQLPTFGFLFAGSHELYRLIPSISQLASYRLAEEAGSELQPSLALLHMYHGIEGRLEAWTSPPLGANEESMIDYELRRCAAHALRQAIFIYLKAAVMGSAIVDTAKREELSSHMRAVFSRTRQLFAARAYVATILWPVLIAGSVVTKPVAQQALLDAMLDGWFQMRQLQVMADLLRLLWADADPRAYGPYGIYLTMQKHGLSISNA